MIQSPLRLTAPVTISLQGQGVRQEEIETVLHNASVVDGVQCAPIPDWVVYTPYPDAPSGPDDTYTSNGLSRLLRDTQVDLTGVEQVWYQRTVVKVLTRD